MARPNKNPSPTPSPSTLTMTASNWLLYSNYGSCVGMPPNPTQISSNSWQFVFPTIEANSLNKVGYVLHPHSSSITAGSLVAQFQVTSSSGTTFVDGKEPFNLAVPASFRFLIMRDTSTEFGRWWSNPQGFIIDNINNQGIFTLSVPLTPENWSSVYGKRGTEALAEFNNCKNYPQFLGLTFGAGGDFGHGIRTQGGTAYFIATDVKLV